jgi:hypothetical protein
LAAQLDEEEREMDKAKRGGWRFRGLYWRVAVSYFLVTLLAASPPGAGTLSAPRWCPLRPVGVQMLGYRALHKGLGQRTPPRKKSTASLSGALRTSSSSGMLISLAIWWSSSLGLLFTTR